MASSQTVSNQYQPTYVFVYGQVVVDQVVDVLQRLHHLGVQHQTTRVVIQMLQICNLVEDHDLAVPLNQYHVCFCFLQFSVQVGQLPLLGFEQGLEAGDLLID